MASINAQLDHVVLLLPHDDVANPPEWLTKHFTISPGGRHADGKTENKLVLFSDGTYLELIAFTSQEARKGHWWDKPYGVVDFALTTPDEKFPELSGIKDRLAKTDTGISYQQPQEGGRLRPDGVELKWRVTFPINCSRGEAPFWCHDVTPRDRRVPCTEDNTSHPSGVLGMAGVEIKTGSHARLSTATAAILDDNLDQKGQYGVGGPHKVPTTKQPSIRIQPADGEGKGHSLTLVLQTNQNLSPIAQKIENDVVSIVFEQPN